MSDAAAASGQQIPFPGPGTVGPSWHLYSNGQRWTFLAILFLVCTSNYIDRQILSILVEPIKREFGASDFQMGLLGGFSFAIFYAVLGIPVARLADRGDRRFVIAASVAIWSAMTALCGLAQNFWQLALARVGVGIGEAGAIPPSQSLIADYFPPEKRTRALAIFMSAATVGYLAAFVGGAQIAAAYGWRAAFLVMGLPGLLLALLAWFGLKEPRRQPDRMPSEQDHEPLGATFRALAAKPTYVLLTTAFVVYFLMAYGALYFVPAYLIRVLGQDLATAGAVYGLLGAIGAVVGTVGGGIITDRLIKKDKRWVSRVPAYGLLLSFPLYELAFLSDSLTVFYIAAFLGGLILAAAVPPMFSILHLVCGSKRRAMAVAITFFFANLIGLGGGPAITGYLSDQFTATYGPVGLRYALVLAMLLMVPAGLLLLRTQRTLDRDLEA
jgi:MFS family permease